MAQRVVVVGAGVYGAAVAAELVQRGALVTVVDAAAPGAGTSGATLSWLNSCGKQPRTYHELNVAGMDAHRKLAATVPGADWYHESGNLEWAAGDAEHKALRHRVEGLLEYGYQARWLTRAQALALEPDLDPAALPGDEIAYYPREGWLQPTRLIAYLLAKASSGGAELIWDDPVTGLDLDSGLVRAVRLHSDRVVGTDAVVNCAGPAASAIARLAGLDLPMANTRGLLVYTTPVAIWVSHVVHSPDIHVRPDGGGRLLLHTGATDEAIDVSGGEARVEAGTVDAVFAAARALYPGLGAAAVESVRIGERPIPADGHPVLGRAEAVPNFHFAVSHSGATLCLHVGALVAAEVLGDDRDSELAPYRLARF